MRMLLIVRQDATRSVINARYEEKSVHKLVIFFLTGTGDKEDAEEGVKNVITSGRLRVRECWPFVAPRSPLRLLRNVKRNETRIASHFWLSAN